MPAQPALSLPPAIVELAAQQVAPCQFMAEVPEAQALVTALSPELQSAAFFREPDGTIAVGSFYRGRRVPGADTPPRLYRLSPGGRLQDELSAAWSAVSSAANHAFHQAAKGYAISPSAFYSMKKDWGAKAIRQIVARSDRHGYIRNPHSLANFLFQQFVGPEHCSAAWRIAGGNATIDTINRVIRYGDILASAHRQSPNLTLWWLARSPQDHAAPHSAAELLAAARQLLHRERPDCDPGRLAAFMAALPRQCFRNPVLLPVPEQDRADQFALLYDLTEGLAPQRYTIAKELLLLAGSIHCRPPEGPPQWLRDLCRETARESQDPKTPLRQLRHSLKARRRARDPIARPDDAEAEPEHPRAARRRRQVEQRQETIPAYPDLAQTHTQVRQQITAFLNDPNGRRQLAYRLEHHPWLEIDPGRSALRLYDQPDAPPTFTAQREPDGAIAIAGHDARCQMPPPPPDSPKPPGRTGPSFAAPWPKADPLAAADWSDPDPVQRCFNTNNAAVNLTASHIAQILEPTAIGKAFTQLSRTVAGQISRPEIRKMLPLTPPTAAELDREVTAAVSRFYDRSVVPQAKALRRLYGRPADDPEPISPAEYNLARRQGAALAQLAETNPGIAAWHAWRQLNQAAARPDRLDPPEAVNHPGYLVALVKADLRANGGLPPGLSWKELSQLPAGPLYSILSAFPSNRPLEALAVLQQSPLPPESWPQLVDLFQDDYQFCLRSLAQSPAKNAVLAFLAQRAAIRPPRQPLKLTAEENNQLRSVNDFLKSLAPDQQQLPDQVRRRPWKRWLRQADAWHRQLRHNQRLDDAVRSLKRHQGRYLTWPTALSQPGVLPGGCHYTALADSGRLCLEGFHMGHCVSSYEDRCAAGQARIFHLQPPGLENPAAGVTVELNPLANGQWYAGQVRGRHNRSAEPMERAAAEELAKLYSKAPRPAGKNGYRSPEPDDAAWLLLQAHQQELTAGKSNS